MSTLPLNFAMQTFLETADKGKKDESLDIEIIDRESETCREWHYEHTIFKHNNKYYQHTIQSHVELESADVAQEVVKDDKGLWSEVQKTS